jgi:hypothetical protein
VAALYFASRGVAAAEVAEAQRALRELLAAATFKFVTSIVGLGSSLVFSWREKALLHRVQRRLAHFCGALEARMVPLTAESIGLAQLAELRQQQHELHSLGRSLLVRVPETVEERLAAELTAAFAPLREAAGAAASRLARVDEWVLQLVLDAAAVPAAGDGADAAHLAGRACRSWSGSTRSRRRCASFGPAGLPWRRWRRPRRGRRPRTWARPCGPRRRSRGIRRPAERGAAAGARSRGQARRRAPARAGRHRVVHAPVA